ncbi:hypothetical protein B1H10_00085 [candidate division KSB1 bacterium 4484_188]|nr:MAG: hypothetical protein B1H10_00085 [candidate division KSB1 bacterium 4484_188]
MKQTATLTIRIPENIKKALEELSKAEQKPVSNLVKDSLRRYIAIHRVPREFWEMGRRDRKSA